MPARLRTVAIFVILYMLAAIVLAAVRFNREFLFYIVLMVIELAGVMAIDRRVRFPAHVLWGLAIWGFLHLCGGLLHIPMRWAEPGTVGALYNLRPAPWCPKYDQVIHVYGFGVATLAVWHCLRVIAGMNLRPTAGPMALVAFAGLGLGALNETVEFAATRLFPFTNVGGYDNTGWDLVSNLIGCLGAVAIIRTKRPGPDTIKA